MKSTSHHLGLECSLGRLPCLAAVLVCCCVSVSQAGRPTDPLPTPLYAFDNFSPQVVSSPLNAGDVLTLVGGAPTVYVAGPQLGLVDTDNDVIDALSMNRLIGSDDTFVILFSVDRDTIGETPPDGELVEAGVPFNGLDQADKVQAAGDQYLSTSLFMLSGASRARAARSGNNTLIINNYNEGGTEFGASPYIPASGRNRPVGQDNVNSTATRPGPVRTGGTRSTVLYFSTTADSPSLAGISTCTSTSGATILYNADPGTDPTGTYACYDELGLDMADEIDGLIVVDLAGDGVFGPGDQVVFSLEAGSPSIMPGPDRIPGASTSGAAADVFIARFGEDPALLASASALGLGQTDDNIESLELLLCDDAMACAEAHGIRGPIIPTMSQWGLLLTALLLLVAGGVLITRRHRARTQPTH